MFEAVHRSLSSLRQAARPSIPCTLEGKISTSHRLRSRADTTTLTGQAHQDRGWRKRFTVPAGWAESKLEARHRLFSPLPASQGVLVSVMVAGVGKVWKRYLTVPKVTTTLCLSEASFLLYSKGLLPTLDGPNISTAIVIKIVP